MVRTICVWFLVAVSLTSLSALAHDPAEHAKAPVARPHCTKSPDVSAAAAEPRDPLAAAVQEKCKAASPGQQEHHHEAAASAAPANPVAADKGSHHP